MSILWVASFDIGKKNFSFYIEEFDSDIIKSIQNINKQSRFNNNGTPTTSFNNILTNIYKTGNKILLENVDLTYGSDSNFYHNFGAMNHHCYVSLNSCGWNCCFVNYIVT